jgi:hypothetical protein
MKGVLMVWLFIFPVITHAQGTKAGFNWKIKEPVQVMYFFSLTLTPKINISQPEEKQLNEMNMQTLQLLLTAFEYYEEVLPIEIKEDALISLMCAFKTYSTVPQVKLSVTDTDFFFATVRQYKLSLIIRL